MGCGYGPKIQGNRILGEMIRLWPFGLGERGREVMDGQFDRNALCGFA